MSGNGEKKSKKKSKSRRQYEDDDDVDKEVRKAMKQVEKAMVQVRLGEKEAKKAQKKGGAAEKGPSEFTVNYGGATSNGAPNMGMGGAQGKGSTFIQSSVQNIAGTYIHVEAAENIMIGNNNTMVLYDKPKKGRKSSRRSVSSEESEGEADEKTTAEQNKDPSQMTEAEKRIYDLLHSDRLITHDDMTVTSKHVGNWRRFLRHLGLDDVTLEQIHEEHQTAREIIVQGLVKWKQKADKTATIGVLAGTLQKVGYMDALHHLNP